MFPVCALVHPTRSMNLRFHQALARITLRIAVTIEVWGPLILSAVLGDRRLPSQSTEEQ